MVRIEAVRARIEGHADRDPPAAVPLDAPISLEELPSKPPYYLWE